LNDVVTARTMMHQPRSQFDSQLQRQFVSTENCLVPGMNAHDLVETEGGAHSRHATISCWAHEGPEFSRPELRLPLSPSPEGKFSHAASRRSTLMTPIARPGNHAIRVWAAPPPGVDGESWLQESRWIPLSWSYFGRQLLEWELVVHRSV